VPTLARDEAFRETSEWSARLFRSAEGAEGMAAFREKRKPAWVKA
jgi:enoyl-CoA hydratase/carnithine racemase